MLNSRNFLRMVWLNRSLLRQLWKRDIAERYRGSAAGIVWALATPLVMLSIYTFVFGVIFKARWSAGPVSKMDYALFLFAGLLVFGIFGECVNRAPTLVASRPSFVKKVVFPLELLPVVALGTALFHFAAGLLILLIACSFVYGTIPWTVLLVPIILVPLLLLSVGLCWLLSSIGVFVHDLRHATPFIVTAMMFLSPIFYPATSVPEDFRVIMAANPLTATVENIRLVVVHGQLPNWTDLLSSTMVNGIVAVACLLWFQRARRAFADVV